MKLKILLIMFFSAFSRPLITRPTRFTETSATIIDNFVSNVLNNNYIAGIMIADISDHLPIFYVSYDNEIDSITKTLSTTRTYRKVTDRGITVLCNELANVDWNDVYALADAKCMPVMTYSVAN